MPGDFYHTSALDRTARELWRPRAFKIRDFGAVIKETAIEWNQDRAQRMGASLAFYTLLSLSPLAVMMVAAMAMVLGRHVAEGQLSAAMNGIMGSDAAQMLQTILLNASKPGAGLVATFISGVTLVIGASTVAAELQDTLNAIWHVPEASHTILSRILTLVKDRACSLALILGGGVVLLLSVSLNGWVDVILKYVRASVAIPEAVLHSAEFAVTFTAITLILAAIYKVLPDVPLRWSDVVLGALFTALLLTAGKEPLGLYLRTVSVRSTYGAAGSLAAILVWIYYSAQLFYFGAEFTKIYARKHGSHGTFGP